MIRIGADGNVEVACWWYDYPNDPFEDPDSTGSGQIRWNNSADTVEIRLSGQKLDELVIQPRGKARRLRRAPEERPRRDVGR